LGEQTANALILMGGSLQNFFPSPYLESTDELVEGCFNEENNMCFWEGLQDSDSEVIVPRRERIFKQ
jgi:hypothetical protein